MKLINKYQQGAAFPYTQMSTVGMFSVLPDAPASTSSAAASSKSSKNDDDFKLLDQSVINEVIKNGLPNEVNHFLNSLQALEKSSPFTKDLNRSQLIALAKEAAHIIHNKKQYEEDLKTIEKNESASDYALNSYGGLYVQDEKGKIKSISLKDYDENRDKYMPLTYGQIAQSRAYGDTTAFDSTMLASMREGIGTKKIAEKIKTLVKALGNQEISEQEYQTAVEVMGRHLKQPTHQQQQGLQELAYAFQELGDDALFSVLQEESSPNMKAAMQYIMNSLGNDEKKTLKAKAFIEGDSSTTPEAMIMAALGSFTTTKQKYSEKTSSTTNSKVNANAQLKASESYYQSANETLFDGNLNRDTITFTDGSYANQYAINLKGTVGAALSNDNNKVYGQGPLGYLLGESGFGKYLDMSSVYYGGKQISQEQLNNIMYDGQQIARVWVPTDGKGNINWQSLTTFHKVLSQLDSIPEYTNADAPTKQMIANAQFEKLGLNIRMNENGEFEATDGQKMEPYMLFYGYAKDDKMNSNNIYTKNITGDRKDAVLDEMERIYEALGMEDPNGFFNYSKLTKAPVLIKQSKFAQMDAKTYSGHGARQAWQTNNELMMKQQAIMNSHRQIDASGSQLFAE